MQTQTHSDPCGCKQATETAQTQQQPKDLCRLSCGYIADERNRYYTGRFLTARDFQDEQDYFLSRHYTHNRLMHGWGIVCGLEVRPHLNDSCQDRYVIVTPGVAIDCCGREIVLKEKMVVKVWEPAPALKREPTPKTPAEETEQSGLEEDWESQEYEKMEEQEQKTEASRHPQPQRGGPFLLVFRYDEQGAEWAPALYAEGACDPRQMEANRVREVGCIDTLLYDKDRHATCWQIHEHHEHEERGEGWEYEEGEENELRTRCVDDCEGQGDHPSPGCIEPVCLCKYGVPLALVTPDYDREHKSWHIGEHEIDLSQRHEVSTPPEYLTHIIHYNWRHGRTIDLSYLRERMDGKLRIYFDRRLIDDPEDEANGINIHTFIVAYHRPKDVDYTPELLSFDQNPPYLETQEGICCAVFPIDDRFLTGDYDLDNCILDVTLKCDFILDCHHHPVDGEHLGAKTPTGDGRPGGTFESWFRVRDDERSKRESEKKRPTRAR
jgi:hypothetical protein